MTRQFGDFSWNNFKVYTNTFAGIPSQLAREHVGAIG